LRVDEAPFLCAMERCPYFPVSMPVTFTWVYF